MVLRLPAIIALLLLPAALGCGRSDEPGSSLPTATPTPTVTPVPTQPPVSSDLAAAVNDGGCYPTALVLSSPLDMLNLVNPEWAPVLNGQTVESEPILVHGLVLDSHGDTGGDFPATHVRSDQNTFVRLDDGEAGRLATGNGGEIALEWEAGAYPDWAWGSGGDRVAALGRWIFDCGHPNPTVGHCSVSTAQGCLANVECVPPKCAECDPSETCVGAHYGYSSEMHPPFATAVMRSGRGALLSTAANAHALPATRTDIFVSSYAGGAGDRCVLTHLNDAINQLAHECYPLQEPVANINEQDFVFDVPLPLKPPGGQVTWRFLERPAPGGVAAAVDVLPKDRDPEPHLEVSVRMTQSTPNGLPTGYAGTLFAGWQNDPTALTHVRVSVDAAVIHNALQRVKPVVPRVCSGSGTACTVAEDCPAGQLCHGIGTVKSWRLQVSVNGEWQELTGLDSVNSGDVIPQAIVFDQYLPSDGEVHVVANGDGEDCIHTMLGKSLKTDLAMLGFANGLNCLLTTPHDPGKVDVRYAGPDFRAPGASQLYETQSSGGEGGACSTTTERLCVLDADCPSGETCATTGGAFGLRYRIERVAE